MADKFWAPLPNADYGRGMPTEMSASPSLYPLRISTRYPQRQNGADISFSCEAAEGGTFYCKEDKGGRLIRASEWIFTHLARHLGIATPDCAILEDPESGATVFGSLGVRSPISNFERKLTCLNRGLGS